MKKFNIFADSHGLSRTLAVLSFLLIFACSKVTTNEDTTPQNKFALIKEHEINKSAFS